MWIVMDLQRVALVHMPLGVRHLCCPLKCCMKDAEGTQVAAQLKVHSVACQQIVG